METATARVIAPEDLTPNREQSTISPALGGLFSERRLRPATQKCKCCGVERPFADFREDKRAKNGRALTCMACEKQKKKNAIAKAGAALAGDIRQRTLQDYTSVELMRELGRRGYDGELTILERKTVRIREL